MGRKGVERSISEISARARRKEVRRGEEELLCRADVVDEEQASFLSRCVCVFVRAFFFFPPASLSIAVLQFVKIFREDWMARALSLSSFSRIGWNWMERERERRELIGGCFDVVIHIEDILCRV